MIEIGKLANKKTRCVITSMDEPLGFSVGNTLEVIEAIEFLKGNMPKDLKEVVLELGNQMIELAGFGNNEEENKNKILENIYNGKAFEKFIELVSSQEGDISYIKDTNKFPKAKYIEEVKSKNSGYIYEINAQKVGKLACFLGAGRLKKEDNIEYEVGIVLNKKVGDFVNENDTLAYIHSNDIQKLEYAKNEMLEIFKVGTNKPTMENTIRQII